MHVPENLAQTKIRVTYLANTITEANEAYRNGTPLMSDTEFDSLEEKLRKLDPNHTWFKQTGAPIPGKGWKPFTHPIPMRGLLKVKTKEELHKFFQGHEDQGYFITEKLDGISVLIQYTRQEETGPLVLVSAATRGDGKVGEDITRNVKLMQGVPLEFRSGSDTVYVRGEIICKRSDFKEHFPEGTNPRNTASGTAKRQSDASKCQHLTVVAYQWLTDEGAPFNKATEIFHLVEAGFQTPGAFAKSSLLEAAELPVQYEESVRQELDYDIDGLVIELARRSVREGLGISSDRPRGSVAYKFTAEQGESVLREILWQVGKSGRITPVAVFEPVTLAGAEIRKASLATLGGITKLLKDKDVAYFSEGDRLLVSRRGDVIPKVEALVAPSGGLPLEPPVDCPVCQDALEMQGEYLVCTNLDECPAQVSGAIKRWVSKLGVKHFGDVLVDELCDRGLVSTIPDLYRLDPEEVSKMKINGRLVGGSAKRAFTSLHSHKEVPLHIFIGSLGIPMIGRSMAKLLVDGGYDTLDKMKAARLEDLEALEGMGAVKAKSFWRYMEGFLARGFLDEILAAGVSIKSVVQETKGKAFEGKSFCLSGFRDAELVKAIEAQGGVIKSGVSKSLTFLILKDASSTSSKAKKARQLGVVIQDKDTIKQALAIFQNLDKLD